MCRISEIWKNFYGRLFANYEIRQKGLQGNFACIDRFGGIGCHFKQKLN